MPTPADAPPQILSQVGGLLSQYEVLLCDVWGVLHDGVRAFPDANRSLSRFRREGGSVVLVSNAPMPADAVASLLDKKGVERSAWDRDRVLGRSALDEIGRRGLRRIHGIGPPGRDDAFFDRLPGRATSLDDADAIACTGLRDDVRDAVADYESEFGRGIVRGLPFICANPDRYVHVGDKLFACAGVLGAEYERRGGAVYWAGKPHPVAYAKGLEVAAGLRGGAVPLVRVLAIGDAIPTDLKAAAGAGVDALFIASGIHRDEVLRNGAIDAERMAAMLAEAGVTARAAALGLAW